jgi:hypothetical protein
MQNKLNSKMQGKILYHNVNKLFPPLRPTALRLRRMLRHIYVNTGVSNAKHIIQPLSRETWCKFKIWWTLQGLYFVAEKLVNQKFKIYMVLQFMYHPIYTPMINDTSS